MLIGILSDIHDNTDHLHRAIRLMEQENCTRLLCLGDMADVSTLRLLRSLWEGEMDLVSGNNDYPRSAFRDAAAAMPATHYHGDTADLTLAGRRIFLAHEPERTLHAADLGCFDAIFFGHTHQAGQMRDGRTLIANPGEIQGRYGEPSFAVYDTDTHTLRHIRL